MKAGSLSAKQVGGGLPAGPAGRQGPQGEKGEKGLQGEQGERGAEGSPGTAVAYATITAAGSVVPEMSRNSTQANVDPDTQTGMVCFTNLPFVPRSAMVAAAYVDGYESLIATAFVSTGTITASDCSGKVQVRTLHTVFGARADSTFNIWFEE